MTTTAYTIGQIMAVLEQAAVATGHSVQQVSTVPATLNTLLTLAPPRIKGRMNARLTDLVGEIAAVPSGPFVAADQADYWLGYHHERARLRGGRPPKEQSDATLTARMEVLLTPAQKEWVAAHGGAEYIRRLIAADIGSTAQ